MNFLYVGGADAASGDFDEQFARADAGDRDGLEAEVIRTAINDGTHGLWDNRHGAKLNR